MKSIAVSASDKIHNLNQLSSSRKYLRPIARYSQNCCRNRRLKNKVFILMSSSRMFVSRPERDNQNYLNTTQCRVSEIFIRGTSSKESRPTVCLLWDSGELCVLFSDEWGWGIVENSPLHLPGDIKALWERHQSSRLTEWPLKRDRLRLSILSKIHQAKKGGKQDEK